MRVRNKTDSPAFAKGHGDLQPGEEATVTQEVGKRLVKEGICTEVQQTPDNKKKEGDS